MSGKRTGTGSWLREKMRFYGSTHYYSGRSIWKLGAQKIFRFIAFLRTEKPKRHQLATTAALRGTKTGKTALVLGNGPSLQRLNTGFLEEFVDEIFVVNDFYAQTISSSVKPTYYALSDFDSFTQNTIEEQSRFKELRQYIQLSCTEGVILPHNIRQPFGAPNIREFYIDDRELTICNKGISPLKPRAYGSVTLYKALSFACFLGFQEILILGLDNTEFFNYRGTLSNEIFNAEYSISHILPNGFAGRMQSYAHLFGDLNYFPKETIVNLDEYSLIDCFKKVSNHPLVRSTNTLD